MRFRRQAVALGLAAHGAGEADNRANFGAGEAGVDGGNIQIICGDGEIGGMGQWLITAAADGGEEGDFIVGGNGRFHTANDLFTDTTAIGSEDCRAGYAALTLPEASPPWLVPRR